MEEIDANLKDIPHDPLVKALGKIITYTVKVLAVLMVVVIIWSLVVVIAHMYFQISETIVKQFNVELLIQTLGAFLAVLIAIEIFLNIIFYLKKDVIHVPLVLATALTAVARKVIILDYALVTPDYIYGLAAIILAVGVSYWLVLRNI